MKIPPRLATAAWLAAWAAATAASLAITKPTKAPIHVDEVYWIGSSYYYTLAFHEWNWSHPHWRSLSARENPPVAKYVIGARLALAGQRVVNRDMVACFRLMFRWPPDVFEAFAGRDLILDETRGISLDDCARAPLGGPGVTRKRELLSMSRHAVIACAIVASLVMLFFGASVADRPTGLLASQLLLHQPTAVEAYSHAMADGVAMMFSIAAAYAAWEFHRRMASEKAVTRRRAALLVVLNGALLGLACGAKMNSLVVVFLFGGGALAAAAMAWKRRDQRRLRLTIGLAALTGVATVATFSLINPAVLIDPAEGLPAAVTYQNLGMGFLQNAMQQWALVTLPDKFVAMSSVASGPWVFLLIGALCWLAAIRRPRHGIWFVGGWWLIATLAVTWWIPFPTPRYVLPVALPFVLFFAYALTSTIAMLAQLRSARASSP